MDYIGTIPIPLWNTIHEIARENNYPMRQPPHCPYIILTKPLPEQLIALCGHFSKQHIELYLMEVPTPDLKIEDRLPLSDQDYETARELADTLLEKAIELSKDRCSIEEKHKIKPEGKDKEGI